jgi:thioredoxin-related protein
MKHVNALVLLIILGISSSQADVKFLHGPMSEALQRATAEKKPVMIDFYTDWCRWCDTLDARTYSDNGVASYINDRVIPIKIDAEKGEGIDLAKKHAVRGYPTTLVIGSDGEEIDRIVGFEPPEKFLPDITAIVKGENTLKTVKAELQAKPNDAETRYRAAQKFASRFETSVAAEHYQKLLELDPKNALGHNEEARYEVALNALRGERTPDKLLTFINDYPASTRISEAYATLFRFSLSTKDTAKAEAFFRRYIEREPQDAGAMNNFAWESATQRANLAYAAEVAARAVALAQKDGERAMYLDTQATVEFVRGNIERAVALEEHALELLAGAPAKTRKDYEDTLAKFKAAQKTSPGR